MGLIEATLKEPAPTENFAPNWSEVLRLARKHFEALRAIDAEVNAMIEAARARGIAPSDMVVDVRQPYDPEQAVYRAVMTALYGPKFWPWRDERMMEIIT